MLSLQNGSKSLIDRMRNDIILPRIAFPIPIVNKLRKVVKTRIDLLLNFFHSQLYQRELFHSFATKYLCQNTKTKTDQFAAVAEAKEREAIVVRVLHFRRG